VVKPYTLNPKTLNPKPGWRDPCFSFQKYEWFRPCWLVWFHLLKQVKVIIDSISCNMWHQWNYWLQ
jgi:hypothetical protein